MPKRFNWDKLTYVHDICRKKRSGISSVLQSLAKKPKMSTLVSRQYYNGPILLSCACVHACVCACVCVNLCPPCWFVCVCVSTGEVPVGLEQIQSGRRSGARADSTTKRWVSITFFVWSLQIFLTWVYTVCKVWATLWGKFYSTW